MRAAVAAARKPEVGAICIGALDALGWLVPALAKRTGLPVFLYTHGEEISQRAYAAKAERARASALRAAEGVLTVSHFTAGLLAEKYHVPADRIGVVTNGVNLQAFAGIGAADVRQQLGLGAGPLVLALGRLVPRKGFDRLLAAWPNIRAAVPTAELALAGTGPMQEDLQALAAQAETGGGVHMLGHVADDLMAPLFASADLFAMPNRTMPDGDTEGFGLVFLEAAACGTPSVGGRAGGAVDAVRDGETGVLVDGDDIASIAAAVTGLLHDDGRRTAMGAAAKRYAASQGWPEKAKEVLGFCGL
jgi:phosphatidylinositol alpha-1,6-mannosyltransferase